MDLRAVMLKSPDAYRPRDLDLSTSRAVSRTWRHRWIATAAAIAAVVVLAVGIAREWNRVRPEGPILRGPGDVIVPLASWRPDGSLQVSWPAQTGAVLYRV